jgi:hypothetical protein
LIAKEGQGEVEEGGQQSLYKISEGGICTFQSYRKTTTAA